MRSSMRILLEYIEKISERLFTNNAMQSVYFWVDFTGIQVFRRFRFPNINKFLRLIH